MKVLTTTTDPATIYRDATYSQETQDVLRGLEAWLGHAVGGQGYVVALRDVLDRWDANDATEMVVEEAV